MDLDEPTCPLLDDFFAGLAHGRSAATRRRVAQVRAALAAAVRARLGTDDVAWSDLEPDDLVDDLLVLASAPWWPEGHAAASFQLSALARLVDHLGSTGRLGDAARADAEQSLTRARRALEHRRRDRPDDAWATSVPARLLRSAD